MRNRILAAFTVAVSFIALLLAPAASASTAPASGPGTNTLKVGEQLVTGQRLITADGQFRIQIGYQYPIMLVQRFQTPGYLEEGLNWAPLRWPTGYARGSQVALVVTSHGDLQLLGRNSAVLWHTGTSGGDSRDQLLLTPGGNVDLEAITRSLWHTGTTSRVLMPLQTLNSGASLVGWGIAASAPTRILMATNGTLAVYVGATLRWYLQTNVSGAYLAMLTGGAMVLLSPAGSLLWASPNAGGPNGRVLLGIGGFIFLTDYFGRVQWQRPA